SVSRDEKILCEGYYDPEHRDRFRCRNHLRGELSIEEALAKSCNVFFHTLAAERLGLAAIRDWSLRFGFGKPTGIELGQEQRGQLPRSSPESAGIGQGFWVTPLQLYRFVCALANRGRLPTPRILMDSEPRFETVNLADSTWEIVIAGMRQAVTQGTASDPELGLHRFDCAVKTGTAEVRLREDARKLLPVDEDGRANISWIIGFAPLKKPEIAFVVQLEYTRGHGGGEGGPVVAAILRWLEQERGWRLSAPTAGAKN
ncbi:MAG: penicillin-binding transpeptidase domain-containing protein, partial [Planctomycetota bacterium]